ncbi:hypothetical protein ACTQ5B_05115 [Bifidobacterium pseudolongum]|nr:hypothetical protein [Bifidobacterium pseudolongum]
MRHATAPIAQPRARARKVAGSRAVRACTVAKWGVICMGWGYGAGGVYGW